MVKMRSKVMITPYSVCLGKFYMASWMGASIKKLVVMNFFAIPSDHGRDLCVRGTVPKLMRLACAPLQGVGRNSCAGHPGPDSLAMETLPLAILQNGIMS